MPKEHRAYAFDWLRFEADLQPLLVQALADDDPAGLEAYIDRHRGELKNPRDGTPLAANWRETGRGYSVQEYGSYALTRFYDPAGCHGIGHQGARLSEELPLWIGITLTGSPIGPPGRQFDPAQIGSYFQTPKRVRESVAVLRESPLPEAAGYLALLERCAAEGRGVYVTFWPVKRPDLVKLYSSAPDPPALRGLGEVDWSAVRHAYGPAVDTPALLRAFVSDVPAHRLAARRDLFNTIWHQGTVYEATATAVPFLYRLLEADDIPNKSHIADLIATVVADGHSYLAVHDRTPEQVAEVQACLAASIDTPDSDLARELRHVAAVRRAVAARLHLLYPYLRDPEPGVRRAVAMAVGLLAEHAARSLLVLRAALRDELEEHARESLEEAVRRLGTGTRSAKHAAAPPPSTE